MSLSYISLLYYVIQYLVIPLSHPSSSPGVGKSLECPLGQLVDRAGGDILYGSPAQAPEVEILH